MVLCSQVRDWCPVLNPFDSESYGVIERVGGDIERLPCYEKSLKVGNICVPAEGDVRSGVKVMIVGQNPGVEEDKEGRPFIGASGRFLDGVLRELGYEREDFYITNVVKCYMETEEITSGILKVCSYCILRREIWLLKPDVIICLGRLAFQGVQFVLCGEVREEFERGKVLKFYLGDKEVKVCATYHPSYVLRANGYEGVFKKDLGMFLREGGRGNFEISYRVLERYEEVKEFVDRVSGCDGEVVCSVDIETTSVDVWDREAKILCIGVGII